jgi:hypothetical protein
MVFLVYLGVNISLTNIIFRKFGNRVLGERRERESGGGSLETIK